MRRSSKPLPKDSNKRAYEIFRLSTEEPEEKQPEPERSEISKYLAEIGRKGGLKGGKARAESLTAKQRRKIAIKAATARWKKK
jgi:hypothetical protein